jgi:hypothetical protein
MHEKPYNRHELSPDAQDNFYESNKKWILSIKERHDPEDLLDILENDPQKYPYQQIGNVLVPGYQPPLEKIREYGGRQQLQAETLNQLELMSSMLMGPENFENFINDILRSTSDPKHPQDTLRHIWGRLQSPRNNVAAVAMHPNIKALPIFSAAMPIALSRADFLNTQGFTRNRPFDLFEFNQQNLMIVNPALSVASFAGRPAFEVLSRYSTLIQAVPPTRNAINYGLEQPTRRLINRAANEATAAHLEFLYEHNKSAYLTIDPTASTADPIIENGVLVGLRRKPVARTARHIITETFKFGWPMTMYLSGKDTAWYIGAPRPLTFAQDFEDMMKELTEHTEAIAGVPIVYEGSETQVGGVAVANSRSD